MTQGQGEPSHRRCPSCGGLMIKPQSSSFYWHADNNHPRCDITNVVDAPLTMQTADEAPPGEPPSGKRRKK